MKKIILCFFLCLSFNVFSYNLSIEQKGHWGKCLSEDLNIKAIHVYSFGLRPFVGVEDSKLQLTILWNVKKCSDENSRNGKIPKLFIKSKLRKVVNLDKINFDAIQVNNEDVLEGKYIASTFVFNKDELSNVDFLTLKIFSSKFPFVANFNIYFEDSSTGLIINEKK